MATYVIGDVHGCFDELQNLLASFSFDPKNDYLWFTGDLINGGPKSVETLEFIMGLEKRAICVLGNHDLTLLAITIGNVEINNTRETGYEQILSHPDKTNILEWLCSRPLTHYDPDLNTLLVHAGVFPQWSLTKTLKLGKEVETVLSSKQAPNFLSNMFGNKPTLWNDKLTAWDRIRCIVNYMTRMRFCTPEGELEFTAKGSADNAPVGTMPWFMVPDRKTKQVNIAFGHWAALNGRTDCNNVFALDTGCIWGNCLSALRLEDKKNFSVNSINLT